MKINILLIILSFFVFENNGYSQKYLELRKASRLKYFSFYPGENIRFKMYEDEYFTNSVITGISDSTLNFNNIQIPVSKIEIIDIRNKTSNMTKSLGLLISGGSLAYFAIDFINLSLVQKANYKDVINNKTLINCSIGIGIGVFVRLFAKKKYFKRNKLNRIWIQGIQ